MNKVAWALTDPEPPLFEETLLDKLSYVPRRFEVTGTSTSQVLSVKTVPPVNVILVIVEFAETVPPH